MTSKRAGVSCRRFLTKPGEGGLADLPLFEGGYGELRNAEGQGFTALNLDKNKSLAVPGDNINFAPLAAIITLDNFPAVALQEGDGKFFAVFADPCILVAFTFRSRRKILPGVAICPSHVST